MKFFLVVVLLFSCSQATGQNLRLIIDKQAQSIFARPVNQKLYPAIVNSMQSCMAAEVNKKLFTHPLFNHHHNNDFASTDAATNFLKHPKLLFRQNEITRHFQPTRENNTLNTIADITGSILDVFLQQYTIQQ